MAPARREIETIRGRGSPRGAKSKESACHLLVPAILPSPRQSCSAPPDELLPPDGHLPAGPARRRRTCSSPPVLLNPDVAARPRRRPAARLKAPPRRRPAARLRARPRRPPGTKVLAKQQMDLLTAKAWLMENKELERKVVKLSIQNSLPSEYTRMVLLQTSLDKIDPAQQAKNKPTKQSSPDELPAMPLGGLALGFGDVAATRENLTTGFGDMKAPEKFVIFEKAVGCCSRVADCCCCMCFIKACSKMNDQCAIVMAQACAALACLGCFECCSELCCGGPN